MGGLLEARLQVEKDNLIRDFHEIAGTTLGVDTRQFSKSLEMMTNDSLRKLWERIERDNLPANDPNGEKYLAQVIQETLLHQKGQ